VPRAFWLARQTTPRPATPPLPVVKTWPMS